MIDPSWPTALDGLDLVYAGRWPSLLVIMALLVTCGVIVIVDWRARIIPNGCNLIVAALGLAVSAFQGAPAALSAALQGLMAFGLFWLARALYRAIRSVSGLGLGDVKFLGAAGIWVGLAGLAPMILVACAAALVFVGLQWCQGTAVTARYAIPFGPFLVLGFVSVVAGTLV